MDQATLLPLYHYMLEREIKIVTDRENLTRTSHRQEI